MCNPLQLTLAKDTTKCCVKGQGAKGDIQPGAQVVFELSQDRRYVPQVLPTRPYLHVPTQTGQLEGGRASRSSMVHAVTALVHSLSTRNSRLHLHVMVESRIAKYDPDMARRHSDAPRWSLDAAGHHMLRRTIASAITYDWRADRHSQ